ncbi:TrkA-C domain-containing protein [Roseomonas rosea]|uniref:TrkA-C domain-containing protein n=1 Tax=Muricoccus roseus TaxID=198092 RepID=A0A1M6SG89_9PROT|nr:SLC13 family permease [Roseomonas rosea]SHK43518.1 TrkA-C domain-containing protein [Roseomonas rosea]
MTLDQGLAFGLMGATIALFLWGRFAYDAVALGALLAGVFLGIVPVEHAFEGFADDVVVIVAAALVISHAVARSGAVETIMRPVTPRLRSVAIQVPVLAGATMLLAMVTKNVGALAILMPVAMQLARRTGTSPAALLMPMSFAAMVGGVVTLVGTAPNIIMSRVRQELTGEPFRMFDYTPVGLGICAVALLFLAVGWRLLPGGRRGAASMDAAFTIGQYTLEARVPEEGEAIGMTVAELEARSEGEVRVSAILPAKATELAGAQERAQAPYPVARASEVPAPDRTLASGEGLMLRGEPAELERLVAAAGLVLAGEEAVPDNPETDEDDMRVVEGVVTGESPLVGRTPAALTLRSRHGVSLLAVSRRGEQRIRDKLSQIRLRAGDVVLLRGLAATMPDNLGELRVLPLAERGMALGQGRRSWIPLAVLAGAMALVAAGLLPVGVAFFGAVVALFVFRVMTTREAYEAVDWPVVVLLAALIPVSGAIQRTGGTDLLAGWLTGAVEGLPALAALAVTMVLAMAVTPFLNNAATVLVMGPIAATLAGKLGLNPDPFLMAVALGAASDFLTPIGHQCNTLVMGPGGYRFGDYARLGLPLSVLVVIVGVPLIAFFWPLAPG